MADILKVYFTLLLLNRKANWFDDLSEQRHKLNPYMLLKKISTKIEYLFPNIITGKWKLRILYTRLRTNCSSLNLHLSIKNISDSPLCSCGSIEDNQHYFFHCMHYQRQRNELLNEIARYATLTLNFCMATHDYMYLPKRMLPYLKMYTDIF